MAKQPEQQAWQHRCVWIGVSVGHGVMDRRIEEKLNELGADGWELTAALPSSSGVRLFLKKPGRAPSLDDRPPNGARTPAAESMVA